jgi:hypothetical protein
MKNAQLTTVSDKTMVHRLMSDNFLIRTENHPSQCLIRADSRLEYSGVLAQKIRRLTASDMVTPSSPAIVRITTFSSSVNLIVVRDLRARLS